MQYRASRVVAGPFLHVLWRPEVTGLENIPETGGALLASNHLSILDSIFLPLVVSRPVTFAAKSEYFTGTRLVDRVTAMYMRATNQLSVDRGGARAAQAMLEAALERVNGGALFGIYPEGTRSRDGRLYRGRTGVAQLALTSGAPIVPVGLRDTDRLQPVGSNRPRLVRVTVTFGEPIDVRGRYDGVPPGRARREITDRVMTEIQTLTGQEAAGVYNDRAPDA